MSFEKRGFFSRWKTPDTEKIVTVEEAAEAQLKAEQADVNEMAREIELIESIEQEESNRVENILERIRTGTAEMPEPVEYKNEAGPQPSYSNEQIDEPLHTAFHNPRHKPQVYQSPAPINVPESVKPTPPPPTL